MIKTELQSNNLDLRALLDAINNLPEKGSGSGEDISEELTAQDALISEISLALDEVAVAQADAFAAIGVTYPEGSICTCSNGTKTLTAKNTSGQALFLIPEADTWTVTSTDPADSIKTKSQSVSITKEEQWESVVLLYREYLIKDGESVVNYSSSTANIYTDTDADGTDYLSIGFDSSSWNGTGYYYYAMDVTNYNTLVLDGFSSYYGQGYGLAKFGVGKTSGTAYTGSTDIQTTRDVFTFDVSKYTGKVYVIVAASGYETSTKGWYSTRARVANMWLER